MRLSPDFNEFVRLAGDHNVRFLVVGGYALAAHGHPRFTKDLDVWILPDPINASRLLDALEEFGFGNLGLSVADFTADDAVIQLGYPPNRIDILTGIDGVDFESCWTRKIDVETDDEATIHFIGVEDLITNKRVTGRLQDLADVEALGGEIE